MYLGIEIGGTKLQVQAGDEHGRIRTRRRLEVDPQRGAAGIQEQLRECLNDLRNTLQITALGVGFGGPIDRGPGVIRRSHQIEGWTDFPLRAWLAEITRLPVMVDNDANMAALGEAVAGAGQGMNPVFYVTLGSGVGGGCVVDGRVYHGVPPTESEIGHLRLDRNGTLVEQRCSGWAIDARIRERIANDPDAGILSILSRESPGHEARHLAQAYQQGDRIAGEILRELSEDLALALSHVTHLFHPQAIILGGGLAKVGEPLRSAVEKRLPAFLMEVMGRGPSLRLSSLGEDAVPVGCLLAAASAAR